MRLDRLLSNSGYGSRLTVRRLIRGGRVRVNGAGITDPGFRLSDTNQHCVLIDEKPVQIRAGLYFMMNKPAGCITALHDPRHATIADYIPADLLRAGLAPAGRLDKDTTGLLLLTSDGGFAHRLTSPKWHIEKEYLFESEGKDLTSEDCERLAKGITLLSGATFLDARLRILTPRSGTLTIREGQYHQVKRMLAALGANVVRLERIRIGLLKLDRSLPPGAIRELTAEQIASVTQNPSDRLSV